MSPSSTVLAAFVTIMTVLPIPALSQRVTDEEARLWRHDLRFMSEEMKKWHRDLFHTITSEKFDQAIKALDHQIPSLARHQIIVEMARIVASIGDGHTNIAFTRDQKIGFRRYPLKLYFFSDGLHVRAATHEHAEIVGSRVVRIGNSTVEEAYEAVKQIIGRDNDMGVLFFAPFLLAMPEVLHALGLISDIEDGIYTIERLGKHETIHLKPFGPAEMLAPDTDTSWMPSDGWTDARAQTPLPAPLWLKDPATSSGTSISRIREPSMFSSTM